MLYELPKAQDGEQAITLLAASGERPAVRVFMVAPSPSVLRAARMALSEANHPIEKFADDHRFDAFCRELCLRSMVRWEGIGQDGKAAPMDEGNVRALLTDASVLDKLQIEFIFPYLHREAEKNGSAPSSNGTSPATTGAKDTARAARSAAPNAPTSSKRRRPGKAK